MQIDSSIPEGFRRLFDTSAVPLTLTATDLPDHPLILVNSAFERLSGYSAAEVIGRNCRFLQGDLPNDAARAVIRDALASGTEAQAVFRNYRKNGTRFDNLLFLIPAGPEGAHRYVVGSQFELHGAWNEAGLDSRIAALDAGIGGLVAESDAIQRQGREAIVRSLADYVRVELSGG